MNDVRKMCFLCKAELTINLPNKLTTFRLMKKWSFLKLQVNT